MLMAPTPGKGTDMASYPCSTRPTAFPLVSTEEHADLRRRLDAARIVDGAAPTRGIAPTRIAALARMWRNDFDWSAVESTLEALGSATVSTADGRRLHLLRQRSTTGSGKLAVALLHGWPDTPLMFRYLMPLLIEAGHDVVAPSLPGFGWSDEHSKEASIAAMAEDIHRLMIDLGYSRYAIHGTDWGAAVGSEVALAFREHVAALHLLQPPFDRAFLVDRESLGEAERAYLARFDAWAESAVYVAVHLHQADTLVAALNDSPIGLLAWLAEKYDAWSGSGVKDDDIIAAVATMWFTQSVRSSIRLYSEPANAWRDDVSDGGHEFISDTDADPWGAAESDDAWATTRVEVPTAFAVFPDDIGRPPRAFVERFFAVERFTVMPRGGHWAALEEPRELADDLIAFMGDVPA